MRGRPRGAWLVVLLAGLVLAFAIRAHRADFPFERDEGEYAYAGKLLLEGVPPYTEVHNMKLPGTYYAYALLMALFGRTDSGVRLGLALWTTGSALLVFAIGRRLLGRQAGALAATTFAMLAVSPGVLGLAGHATHFLLLPALLGTWLLLRPGGVPLPVAFLAGIAFGAAFLMKQHAAAFVLCGAVLLVLRERAGGLRRLAGAEAVFLAGAAAPYGALCLHLAAIGAFEEFWFWTVTYARQYVTRVPVSAAAGLLLSSSKSAIGWNFLVWIAAAAGAAWVFRDGTLKAVRPTLAAFVLCSFAAVVPGFYFRPHYFISMLPAVALLAAAGAAGDGDSRPGARRRAAWTCLVLAAAAVGVSGYAGAFFAWDDVRLARTMYGTNPFLESREIAGRLRAAGRPGDRIAVLGSEPQIPFYADMRSATRYVYAYALMEVHPYAARLQEETVAEIEAVRPRHLVLVHVGTSWLPQPGSDRRIFRWIDEWVPAHYDVVGLVEIFPGRPAVTTWGEEAAARRARSDDHVLVFRRRDGGSERGTGRDLR